MSEYVASNINARPISLKHSNLIRSDGSLFRSVCPMCKEGILLVCRDQKTFKLLAEDHCILCGQKFIYEDIETIGQPRVEQER